MEKIKSVEAQLRAEMAEIASCLAQCTAAMHDGHQSASKIEANLRAEFASCLGEHKAGIEDRHQSGFQKVQELLEEHKVETESIDELPFAGYAGLPASKSQVNYRSVRQHPNPMFGTLDPSNAGDSKVLLDFYQNKFNHLDLSKVNAVHAQTNSRLTLKNQMSATSTWDETQLRLINKDIVRQFG